MESYRWTLGGMRSARPGPRYSGGAMALPRRLESVHVVRTPEYVEFEYPLAGLASRFLAWLLDGLIASAITTAAVTALAIFALAAGSVGVAMIFVVKFVVDWGYFVFWECTRGGRSPGKMALGLRVLQDSGVRIGFYASALRNLVRVVDSLPILYLVGGVSAAFTRDSKRLGDLAAGTIVVRDTRRKVPDEIARPVGELAPDRKWTDRVRRASVDERELFLSACLRREEMEMPARLTLFPALARYAAARFAVDKPEHLSDEKFVVVLTAAMQPAEPAPPARPRSRPAPQAPGPAAT